MRQLVVGSIPGELRAALLIDDVPVELALLREDEPSLLDARFRGRVVRRVPALPGAFVDIGIGRPAFLPAKTLPDEGAWVNVELVKDAAGDKGAEIRLDAAPVNGTGVLRLDTPSPPLTRVLDQFEGMFDCLTLDRRSALAELRRYTLPDGVDIELYEAADFDARTGLGAAFDEAVAPTVAVAGGGRMHIGASAAFTAIDVDLGAASDTRQSAAAAILAVNLAAARAIARQLRLRRIGGAVVIDFISMRQHAHRDRVAEALAQAVRGDVEPCQLHGWTRLGHFELTRRRRLRPIGDYLLVGPGTAPRLSPAAIGWAALRALGQGTRPPGHLCIAAGRDVAAELEGPLKPYLERIVSMQIGIAVTVEIDPARSPDTFDIRSLPPHL